MSEQSRQPAVFKAPGSVPEGIETVARFDGVALAEVVREGVELVWRLRPGDTEFQDRVRTAYSQAEQLLTRVEGAEEVLEILGRPFPDSEG